MKNIFGFIGSPLGKKSNTYTFTMMLIDKLKEMDKEITTEIMTAGDVKIGYCKGCWSCMTRGVCPQDKTDDMQMLKDKMLEADFIIWGSPVYTMNVTGQMKTYLDRLCAWYHLMRLAGKPGMVVSTTAGSGTREVCEFLQMLLSALGVKTVAQLETRGYFPGMLADPDESRKKAEEAAEIIYPYITGQKLIESDEYMEQTFQAMKNKVLFGAKWLPADHDYWEKNDMLKLDSFSQLLDETRKNVTDRL